MTTLEEARIRAAAAYNAAADRFDHPVNSFWDRFGRVTVGRLDLKRGHRVLDLCCGSGASALPAAERVGPDGFVLGLDLAENLLTLARAKAAARGLFNAEFRVGDLLEPGLPEASFDAVVCVFGIFFVPDMVGAVRNLWRLVRPGGTLAITTWGRNFFEPANSLFWQAVRSVRPELYKGFHPWDRIDDPAGLRALLAEAGIDQADIEPERYAHPLSSPDDWWTIACGSGYRGTIDQLSTRERAWVRERNLDALRQRQIVRIEASVLYAVGRRDGGP
ncbi:class I SAM-dependent methyltransferase [Candidatus Methylocalor cossyra]|uniref:Methyltransferase type 11 n=1 Tax=Candidatus Methylocalor cossyra TaxID=3108543 RepID=A0ABP1C9H7_9GAMM